MQDDYYYSEVEKLAGLIHRNKGNPRAGALDSWKQAEAMMLQRASGLGARVEEEANPYNSLVSV